MKKLSLIVNKIYFGGLLLLPIVLLILPADFFDKGKSMCLSVIILGKTCPSCGMTRAIQHLIHLDIQGTMEFNKLAFIVLPALIVAWFLELRRSYKYIKENKSV